MSAFDDAIDVLFGDPNMAEDVILSVGSPDTIKAIVTADHVEVDVAGARLSERAMVVTCRTADVEDLTVGLDGLTVRGTAYTVYDSRPDGSGVTMLVLDLP